MNFKKTYEIFAVSAEVWLLEEGGREFVAFDLEDVLFLQGTLSGRLPVAGDQNLFVLLLDLLLQVLMNLLV